jgi:hypothetical protein
MVITTPFRRLLIHTTEPTKHKSIDNNGAATAIIHSALLLELRPKEKKSYINKIEFI